MQIAKHGLPAFQRIDVNGYNSTKKKTTIELFSQLNEIYRLLYVYTDMPEILCCVRNELYHIWKTLIEAESN